VCSLVSNFPGHLLQEAAAFSAGPGEREQSPSPPREGHEGLQLQQQLLELAKAQGGVLYGWTAPAATACSSPACSTLFILHSKPQLSIAEPHKRKLQGLFYKAFHKTSCSQVAPPLQDLWGTLG
jgi:hypothetical protein